MTAGFPTNPAPIAQVASGMRVVDAAGDEIGTVDRVRMGDPNAVAAQGPTVGSGALEGRVPDPQTGDEPEVPPDLAARLLRTGYLKIDSDGLFARDLYVGAEQIAGVNQDVVELSVTRSRLTREE
ncbi:hypothetical protein SAMN05444365_111143 [Micromonospora pattaloongensis]|uniref:PRC-barrel domain-containing protein n=1 Tax=Micromonospora pattaloongensis TaxID=405436 RepID=A0A1H3SHN3_9ACTN|nr:hypothetical protein [Micromonospora pattaloongensis]SDZ37095.1 hypothetical protein SAMN05444365_111143 [Micromonospora pattaloongensis]